MAWLCFQISITMRYITARRRLYEVLVVCILIFHHRLKLVKLIFFCLVIALINSFIWRLFIFDIAFLIVLLGRIVEIPESEDVALWCWLHQGSWATSDTRSAPPFIGQLPITSQVLLIFRSATWLFVGGADLGDLWNCLILKLKIAISNLIKKYVNIINDIID